LPPAWWTVRRGGYYQSAVGSARLAGGSVASYRLRAVHQLLASCRAIVWYWNLPLVCQLLHCRRWHTYKALRTSHVPHYNRAVLREQNAINLTIQETKGGSDAAFGTSRKVNDEELKQSLDWVRACAAYRVARIMAHGYRPRDNS
jgi:hypothetical protein